MEGINYHAALGWLLSLPDWERGTGARPARESLFLERPRALLNALQNPQSRYRSVLIAGTKGKGSTAAMLESILRAAGLQTGLYTSPHLHSYRERIRVNGELISEVDFARGIGEIQPLLDDLILQHSDFESFTTFEVMTALALQHFAHEKIDVAILEVGLGGRLDATNVVDADLSLITPISFDHTAVLGNTLHKIAFEKAGIIKAGKIVLSAPQEREASNVIENVAREKNATLGVGERDWLWLGGHDDFMVAAEPRAGLWNGYWHEHDLHVPLLGAHQFVNAGLAVAGARVIGENWGLENAKRESPARVDLQSTLLQSTLLQSTLLQSTLLQSTLLQSTLDYKSSGARGDSAIARGLATTRWAGRLEILQDRDATRPLIITDGAHNGDSAEKLSAGLNFHFEFEKLFFIFGVLGDKELDAIAKPFLNAVEFVWAVKTNHPRAREASDIAMSLNALGMNARAATNFEEGLQLARERASPRDLILITGSLYIVAQARAAFGLAENKDPPS